MRIRSRLFAANVAYLAAVGGASGATLSWQPVDGCPAAEDGRFAIEQALRQPLSRAKPTRIDVILTGDPARGYTAKVRLTKRPPSPSSVMTVLDRELSAADCWELTDAIAAITAIAIGSNNAPSSDGRDGWDAAPDPSAAAELPRRDALRDGEVAVQDGAIGGESGLGVGASASLFADRGTLRRVALGAELGASVYTEPFELRATVALLVPQNLPVTGAEHEVSLDALMLGAVMCWQPWARDNARTSMCTGWELSRWSGAARTDDSGWWTGPRAELGASWAPDGLRVARLGVRIGGVAPLTHPAFRVRSDGSTHDAYHLQPIIARAWTGVEVSFP